MSQAVLGESCFSSTAQKSPIPLISCKSFGFTFSLSEFSSYSPSLFEFSIIPSSCNTFTLSMHKAVARLFPPYVEPCDPGSNTSITSLSASTQDTGYYPPEMDLPRMSMSGLCWN